MIEAVRSICTAALASAVALVLLFACTPVNFGEQTQAVWCEALLRHAPTASVNDTAQTQEDVADIGAVIDGLCK